jgi:hypothetical protein
VAKIGVTIGNIVYYKPIVRKEPRGTLLNIVSSIIGLIVDIIAIGIED